jgi:Response regulator containing a CheY-like receiver domain and an HTH DNA-binding domain
MLTYIIPGLLASYAPALLPLAAALISGAMFIIFILLSPAYSKYLFFSEWSDDFYRADMTGVMQTAETSNRMEELGLSPREKEIAAMLLQGGSAKQIADKLGITVNTANFHIKNLYKKLGVRSRAELFARFSAAVLTSGQQP